MIIKKWSGTGWEPQSPQVTYTDIVNSVTGVSNVNNGNPQSIFNGGKLRENYLPDSIFSGLKFVGGISRTTGSFLALSTLITGTVSTGFSITSNLDTFAGKTYGDGDYDDDVGTRYVGHYWVSNYSGSLTVNDTANSGAADFDTNVYDDGIAESSGYITVERGDWIVITNWDETNSRFKFSVINNQIRNATVAGHGIVILSEADNVGAYNSETNDSGLSSGSDDVLTEGQLLNLMGTGVNTIAYGNHAHGNITSDGKVGTTANLMLKTTTDGLVTTLAQGSAGQFLRYDGTWATPAYTNDTNTTYAFSNVSVTNGSKLRLTDSNSTNDDVDIVGSGATTVTHTAAGTITISSTDNNTTYSISAADVDGDDDSKYIVLTDSANNEDTVKLTAGDYTTIARSGDTITITGENTTYSDGNGIGLSGATFSVDGGQGLTQEADGLAMTYPVYHGDTLPTLTNDTKYNNVIGFEW